MMHASAVGRAPVPAKAAPLGAPAPAPAPEVAPAVSAPLDTLSLASLKNSANPRVIALIARYSDSWVNKQQALVAVQRFLASPTWRNADAATREKLLDIALALDAYDSDPTLLSRGRSPLFSIPLLSLAELMEGTALSARSSTGTTALDELHRFQTRGLGESVKAPLGVVSNTQALTSLVEELNDAGRIEQGRAASCTMTSISFALLTTEPGEYARICVDLMTYGSSRLRSGLTLRTQPASIETSLNDGKMPKVRSASERLLQSALMCAAYPEAQYTSNHAAEQERFERFDQDNNVYAAMPLGLRILFAILFPVGIVMALIPYHDQWIGVEYDRVEKMMEAIFGCNVDRRHLFRGLGLSRIDGLADETGCMRDPRTIIGFSDFGDQSVGHALNLLAIDRTSHPVALICRNPWGSFSGVTRGVQVEGAPPGIVYEDGALGTVRIPMNARMLRSLQVVEVPQ